MALIQSEDEALSSVLTGILSHLRGHSCGRCGDCSKEKLIGEAERFMAGLARHVRHAGETVFPILRKSTPGSAGTIESLEQEHRLLGLYARELARQIRETDGAKANGIARPFMALLLDHLRREKVSVDGREPIMEGMIVGSLGAEFRPPGEGQ